MRKLDDVPGMPPVSPWQLSRFHRRHLAASQFLNIALVSALLLCLLWLI